jgi:hypothetical protein
MPVSTLSPLRRIVAAKPDHRFTRPLHRRLFGQPFRGKTAHQLLILFEPNRISYTSIYPFIAYAEEFLSRYDAEIRLLPVQAALAEGLPRGLATPTHVLAQSWLTDPPERQAALARLLDSLPPATVTAYMDSFANNDIRLAARFPDIDLYFKKSLFADPQLFLRPTVGHTNLSEYYGSLYGLTEEKTDWAVPEAALAKLRIAPNFLTDPTLMAALLDAPGAEAPAERDIDLHARLGGIGADGWYGAMRRHAETTVDALSGLRIVTGTGVDRKAFMQEMRRARACFSPFGYGELCWRDIEAIAAGTALVKPDMSHLKTEPDLYHDGETYIACRWDFSDLEDKVTALLADEVERARIARNALRVARDYLNRKGPVRTYGALFSPDAPGPSSP